MRTTEIYCNKFEHYREKCQLKKILRKYANILQEIINADNKEVTFRIFSDDNQVYVWGKGSSGW